MPTKIIFKASIIIALVITLALFPPMAFLAPADTFPELPDLPGEATLDIRKDDFTSSGEQFTFLVERLILGSWVAQDLAHPEITVTFKYDGSGWQPYSDAFSSLLSQGEVKTSHGTTVRIADVQPGTYRVTEYTGLGFSSDSIACEDWDDANDATGIFCPADESHGSAHVPGISDSTIVKVIDEQTTRICFHNWRHELGPVEITFTKQFFGRYPSGINFNFDITCFAGEDMAVAPYTLETDGLAEYTITVPVYGLTANTDYTLEIFESSIDNEDPDKFDFWSNSGAINAAFKTDYVGIEGSSMFGTIVNYYDEPTEPPPTETTKPPKPTITPDPDPVYNQIIGEKATIDSIICDGLFEFALYESDSDSTLGAQIEVATCDEHGMFEFASQEYTENGIHWYIVKEVNTAIDGWEYDTTEYLVQVIVTLEDGVLTVQQVSDEIIFVNTYVETPEPSVSPSVTPPSPSYSYSPPPVSPSTSESESPSPTTSESESPSPTTSESESPSPTEDISESPDPSESASVEPSESPSVSPEPSPEPSEEPYVPGGDDKDVPPEPMIEGNELVWDDDGFFWEFDEDGVPLGEWHWNDDNGEWEYTEYIFVDDLPTTGRNALISVIVFIVGVVLASVGLAIDARRRKRFIRVR